MGDAVQAAPKKIIICCDGTWQSSVSGKPSLPSNITRIARTVAKAGKDADGKVWQQIVYYDAGIGTSTASSIESSIQGATGEGLITDVLEAYNFVVNNYSPGDKIYCFGFSRGATTARAVAGMITDFGVIKPEFMNHFPTLLDAYRKNLDKHTFRKTKEYFEWYAGKRLLVPKSKQNEPFLLRGYDQGVRSQVGGSIEHEGSRSIELVGVFDTVQSLGLGDTRFHNHGSSRRQYEWLNVKWNPYIKHAFHALALDERRQPFLPTLYYVPSKEAVKEEIEALKKDEVDWPELKEHRQKIDRELQEQRQRLEKELAQQKCPRKVDLVQVWFTGVHINVGGGSGNAEDDFEGLANMTFAWMIDQCRPYLAFEDFTNDTIVNYLQRVAQQSEEKNEKQSDTPGFLESVSHTVSEYFYPHPTEEMVRPVEVHPEAPGMMSIAQWAGYKPKDSLSLIFQAISSPANRAPGASDDRSAETHKLIRDLNDRNLPNEYMHPSVWYRLDKAGKTSNQTDSHKEDDESLTYKSIALEGYQYTKKNGVYGWAKKSDKGDIWIPEWPILAALEPKDRDQDTNEYSEMALIDKGEDSEEVRKFLSDHAAAWRKAMPGW